MSSQLTGTGTNDGVTSRFGANEWLVEEMYEQYVADKNAVDPSWWPILENYRSPLTAPSSPARRPAAAPSPAASAPVRPAVPASPSPARPATQPVARTTSVAPKPQPVPADVPVSAPKAAGQEDSDEAGDTRPLRGMAKALAKNMDQSLAVPTATSARTIPAKLMIDNRIVINNHLRRNRGGKVSFTHLIGWAMIQAIKTFPGQNVHYAEVDGKASIVSPAHVGLGIAIDVKKADGSRALVVPSIKRADTMGFGEFLAAYEDLVSRARDGKLTADDYAGTTISLTNPGGIGTVHSVPRLMAGQGCIIGAGALAYPAEFQGASTKTLTNMAIGKTITLTSTYDHRVIQGAASGEFLKILHGLLIGENRFYEDIFAALRIPYEPIRWAPDISVDLASAVDKTARVQELINSFRVRGHLMADVDPLEYRQRSHPDLDVATHGLTFWDLDRTFVAGRLGGNDRTRMSLRDILGVLRDSYCRTTGIEYMHIDDPAERAWIQEHVEKPYAKPTHDEQLHILGKLNQAEAFETFLQTKYVGQKRFSLEGGESTIALLDRILQGAADAGLDGVGIGMAHRGRLNVLTNIAGKTYGQIFREFEGTTETGGDAGSGDVKYHLGTEGTFTAADGTQIPIYLAANPSHLEAVDAVLEGIVRAKQDHRPAGTFTTLPILIHGDAALAGQGVVSETLQMSQLRPYRIGGTIHITINNQIGFTTSPNEGRTSVYSTDVAKAIQAPIFHVNGDDPEAVVRVGELAFAFRQQFKKDVVIDLVCYRRRGHNEGDDPSMTQPLMYNLIGQKRSVRKLYSEALIGRGDITEEEYDQAHQDFQDRLERAFAETHAAQTHSIPIVLPETQAGAQERQEPESTGVGEEVLHTIGDAFNNPPAGFTVHSKVARVLARRQEMSRNGKIDWAFGEMLALGSLLLEGTPVRMAGQDSRRGTFVQRHAVMHDRENGQEWLPLANLSDNQARTWIYDSLLSEYSAVAYEYGYSVERPDALVMWEAQFGDFMNGA
ncbi:MAG TPA: multifunctional oxoglutarate decarboxylase/oxoglutarate dehydrogenase thiamine pyrophosphate-binding subunit/dihydrolipoyllysine-residue succinyltransferase subunit, partial [Microbacteriaceae bacterium]|nr:multifunctional oxoglutarate decarboxylase/oxoglutarate dehydrogenase thiamine pyrophosphate-binding subunit/dihydrolipoyllysine-residue succinyltransferase subunit [Microbacteriaceae bacterium]